MPGIPGAGAIGRLAGSFAANPVQTARGVFQGVVLGSGVAWIIFGFYGWKLAAKDGEPDAERVYDASDTGIAMGTTSGSGSGGGGGGAVPGEGASKQEVAAYYKSEMDAAGLPPEIAVMTALVESEMQTGAAVRYMDHDSAGPFQIRTELHGWSLEDAESYATSLLDWFIPNAKRYQGMYSAGSEGYGMWCQAVQGSAFPEKYAYRYDEAMQLLGR